MNRQVLLLQRIRACGNAAELLYEKCISKDANDLHAPLCGPTQGNIIVGSQRHRNHRAFKKIEIRAGDLSHRNLSLLRYDTGLKKERGSSCYPDLAESKVCQ